MPTKFRSREHDVEDFFNMTGAAMNHTRVTSAPLPIHKSAPLKASATGNKIHLDLYNFEDPLNDTSKYVLTSPRSLEACSRFSLKPVELLYKPLIEYQEELIPHGLPMRTIYSLYEEAEKERSNKLEMCREEREKIIEEEVRQKELFTPTALIKTSKRSRQTHKSPSHRENKDVEEFREPPLEEEDDYWKDELTLDKKQEVLSDDDPVGEGSIQRRRTAWMTSVGHDRITSEELRKRVEELHEREKTRKAKMISSAAKKSVLIKPPGGYKKSAKKGLVKKGKAKNAATQRKKQARQNKAGGDTREEVNGSENGHGVEETGGDMGSTSDLASIASSRATRSSVWSTRDPTADAKPITDAGLRTKLKSASKPGARVTPRDQRILELMMAKREEERKIEQQRQSAQRKWEEEKKKDAEAKAAETVRRRSLSDAFSKKRRDSFRSSQGELASSMQHLHHSHHHDHTGAPHHTPSKEDCHRKAEDGGKCCDRHWATQSQRLLEEKRRGMEERRLANLQRKKSQEERYFAKKKEEEEFQQAIKSRQERDLRRASSMREMREGEQKLQRKLKTYYTKKKTEERIGQLRKQSEEEKAQMAAALELKMKQAESAISDRYSRHGSDIRRSHKDLSKKIEQSRSNKQKMDAELEAWHKDLESYRKLTEKQAEEKAKQALEEKRRRAAEERKQKARIQKLNMKKLLDQEEEWKADVEATIAMKDARSKMLQMEKEEILHESRAMAMASQQMREELRLAYSTDHIDQLAKRAELENKLSGGVNNATKNFSTLTLG